MDRAPLRTVVRDFGRIGVLGFGGPPVHVALLRELCVERRRWLGAREFEDANAACGLLPGPASTQLAIFCARRAGGVRGGLAGGLAFILPGLGALIALAALALGDDPPTWIRAVGAGAGAVVVAVVVQAGIGLARSSVRSARAVAYVAAGAAATAFAGAGVVLVILGCGLVELAWRRSRRRAQRPGDGAARHLATLPAIAWLALKVGGLAYGGGFVIVPLMQSDAVDVYGWMTRTEFLDAVAYGQLTPGPVTQTIAAVGYAASGLGGALLAALVVYAPSFLLILLGYRRFARLRESAGPRAFLDGAGPAAVGAILGATVPLAAAVTDVWQYAVLALGALALALGRPAIAVLAGGALAGLVALAAGLPV